MKILMKKKKMLWEICNHFDKEYYFELVKSTPERIKVVIKEERQLNINSNSPLSVLGYSIFSSAWLRKELYH